MILNSRGEEGYTLTLEAAYPLGLGEKDYPQKKYLLHKLHALNIPCTSPKSPTDDTEQTDLRFQVQAGKESGRQQKQLGEI